MRLDRPIGTWLLYWPCAWSVALAGVGGRWDLFAWLALGAFAMRSAGCVYNDIVDRELDRSVERVSPAAAGEQAGVAALGLAADRLAVPRWARRPAAAKPRRRAGRDCQHRAGRGYPFMKRITWWPQAWLGIVFSWGALVGWPAVTQSLDRPALLLWLGCVAWVIGYDTLYAVRIGERALVGVKSLALRLGARAPLGSRSLFARFSFGRRQSGPCDRNGLRWRPCFQPPSTSPIRRCAPGSARSA